MEKERNGYLDFVKGFAIFLVLWGHCIQYGMEKAGDFFENGMFKLIYSFHMPLFMLISGYLFYNSACKRNLRSLIVSRLHSLGLPILLWGCLPEALKWIFSIYSSGQDIMEPGVLNTFCHNIIKGAVEIWFLWAVLLISLIVSFAEKLRVKWGGG